MATKINVGQTQKFKISYLDAAGNEIVPTPTPDSPPQWSHSVPADDDLAAAADGNTAQATGIAAGDDTISLVLSIGGVQFTATEALTVIAVAPVVTSIAIVADGPPTP